MLLSTLFLGRNSPGKLFGKVPHVSLKKKSEKIDVRAPRGALEARRKESSNYRLCQRVCLGFHTARKDGNFIYTDFFFYLRDGLCRKRGTAYSLSASPEVINPHGINERFSFN